MENSRRFWSACVALALVLFAIELWFLPLPGIQQDEVLFLKPFLRGETALYNITIGGLQVPAMVMSYVGCLKTWLYWPVFRIWHPDVWSIRLPVCLVSLCTLLLFAGLVRKVAGPAVALGAAILLMADPSFVFTNVFDWGPVALLMAGAVGILVLLLRAVQTHGRLALAAAFLLAGAMLWYKALFAFPLAGILIAGGAVFPKQLVRLAAPRNLAPAAIAGLVGALPLLLFNAVSNGATLKATSSLEHVPVREKLLMLRLTLDGRAFEHLVVRSVPHEVLPLSGAPLGELVQTWYRTSGLGPGSFLFASLCASVAALPFLRRSRLIRPILFVWAAGISMALLFLVFGSAGSGPHHTALLAPAASFLVTATAAAVAERWRSGPRRSLLAGIVMVVALSEAVLLTNYHRAAWHNGYSVYWTDATRPLAAALRGQSLPVAFLDWGIEDPVRVESGDRLQVVPPTPARTGVLYITHGPEYQLEASRMREFLQGATAQKLVVSGARTIPDSHGNPVLSAFSLAEVTRGQ